MPTTPRTIMAFLDHFVKLSRLMKLARIFALFLYSLKVSHFEQQDISGSGIVKGGRKAQETIIEREFLSPLFHFFIIHPQF